MDTLQGCLLVASPMLPDANFWKSVVLVVEHSSEGAVGLVLNRVSGIRLEDLWNAHDNGPCESEAHVSLGGPVNGPLMCLHQLVDSADMIVLPGVYFTSDAKNLRSIVQGNEPCRMFLGYSGWGPCQLESELKAGGWIISRATKEIVFSDDVDTIWKRSVNETGQEILRETLRIHRFPDPSYN